MSLDADLLRQFTIAEDLEPGIQFFDRAACDKRFRRKAVAIELLERAYIDDGVLFVKNVGETTLRQPSVQGHLTAFETAHFAVARSRLLAFCAAAPGFA